MNFINEYYEDTGRLKRKDINNRFVKSVAKEFGISEDTIWSLLAIYIRLDDLLAKTFISRLKNPKQGACEQLMSERYYAALKLYNVKGHRYRLSDDEIEQMARSAVDKGQRISLPELDKIDTRTGTSVLYSIFIRFGDLDTLAEEYYAIEDEYRRNPYDENDIWDMRGFMEKQAKQTLYEKYRV